VVDEPAADQVPGFLPKMNTLVPSGIWPHSHDAFPGSIWMQPCEPGSEYMYRVDVWKACPPSKYIAYGIGEFQV
jgi:hypothetical protein